MEHPDIILNGEVFFDEFEEVESDEFNDKYVRAPKRQDVEFPVTRVKEAKYKFYPFNNFDLI